MLIYTTVFCIYRINMQYKFSYFYKIQNLINGKFYYGIHSTNKLNDGYLGSGLNIKSSIKKYGKKNFKKKILIFFDSRIDAFNYEEKFIIKDILIDPSCYNISLGRNRGGDTSGMVNTLDPITGEKFFISIKDKRYINGSLIHILKGYVITKDSSGQKFKVKLNDKRYINGDICVLNKGCNKGRKLSNITRKKISASMKGKRIESRKKLSEKTKEKISKSNKGHQRQTGKLNSQYNKKWIINYDRSKRLCIDKTELDTYLNLGWVLGRKLT